MGFPSWFPKPGKTHTHFDSREISIHFITTAKIQFVSTPITEAMNHILLASDAIKHFENFRKKIEARLTSTEMRCVVGMYDALVQLQDFSAGALKAVAQEAEMQIFANKIRPFSLAERDANAILDDIVPTS